MSKIIPINSDLHKVMKLYLQKHDELSEKEKEIYQEYMILMSRPAFMVNLPEKGKL